MILEWLDLHKEELMENWDLAQKGAKNSNYEKVSYSIIDAIYGIIASLCS